MEHEEQNKRKEECKACQHRDGLTGEIEANYPEVYILFTGIKLLFCSLELRKMISRLKKKLTSAICKEVG